MKRVLCILLILCSFTTFSQVADNSYRLFLTDKNNTTFTVENPEEFLSQRAIDRRVKYNIEIANNDLPVSKYYTDSLKSLGFKVLNKSKWLNSVVVYSTNQALIDTITNLGFVKSKQKVETKLAASVFLSPMANQLSVNSRLNDYIDYGFATTQISMVNGHTLHINGYKGQGLTIAIIDGGFQDVDILPAFDSLWANKQILGTRDFVDKDTLVFDASSHGMKVLSIIGGNIPGKLIGTAPKANFWLLRSEETATENTIEEDNWVEAAEFADSAGCDIITSSLGYSEFDDSTQNHSYADMDGNSTFVTRAADIAASKGILVLNSAGNLADDPWKYISAPADGDSVLTVGSVDEFASYSYFSGLGPTYDGRIKPNVVALGYQTALQGTNGNITAGNGTSFSTPIIAGMAACLWQYYPDLNNMGIIKKIEESAHQYSNPDFMLGYGIPDFGKAASLTTGINTFAENTIVKIYPNPFTENIQISLYQKTKNDITVNLFNLTGVKIFHAKYDNIKSSELYIRNLDNLPVGIYLINIRIGSQVIQRSIIKI